VFNIPIKWAEVDGIILDLPITINEVILGGNVESIALPQRLDEGLAEFMEKWRATMPMTRARPPNETT
jgi:hypothetical protein